MRLSLVRNQLTEVPSDALIILKNLNQLDLSDNKITKLHRGIFEGGLYCIQGKFYYAAVSGLDKLDTLAMNHNQLTRLDAGDFEGLPRLTSLSLDYNKITHIDNEAFRGLEGECGPGHFSSLVCLIGQCNSCGLWIQQRVADK